MKKFDRLPSLSSVRVGRQFPVILAHSITICLLLLLVWSLGRIAWIWVNPDSQEVIISNSFSANSLASGGISYDISQLLSKNFFGVQQQKNTAPSLPVAANARPTNLNLKLVGLVASTDINNALAVIAASGKQQIYGIGEKINGSRATVVEVLPDRVVLNNGGRSEILMLDGLQFEPSTKSSNFSKAPIASTIPTNVLSTVKAELLKNPQSLLKYFTLSQQRDDGGIVGYRIGPGQDGRLFSQSGLQPNDLVTNINGADLRNPNEMANIWQKLSDASEINLTVLRDGQEYNVLIGL